MRSVDPGANFRDLGGLEGGLGRLRPGLLFRSGVPRPGLEEFRARARGPRLAVIDLRTDSEVGSEPVMPGVERHHVPLFAEIAPSWVSPRDLTPGAIAGRYLEMLDAGVPSMRVILGLLASSEGSTLVHCAAGRDRTGIVVAVVLGLLGVERHRIAEDYARSEGLPDGMPALSETMSTFLEGIDSRYGSVDAMVRGWGVDGDEVERLRNRFVEEGP